MGWIVAALGLIVIINKAVKYFNSDSTDNYGELDISYDDEMDYPEPAVKKTPTVKKASAIRNCYLKVKVGDFAPKWEENIRDNLPASISTYVLKYMLNMLYDHLDRKGDEIDVNALERRTITISFSVEADDGQVFIKDLDDFRKDLKNNIYTTAECVVLVQVFTHLVNFDN